MSLLSKVSERFNNKKQEKYTLNEYIELLKTDSSVKSNSAERMLKVIGDPVLIDTSKDPKISRIFANKIIKTYPTFSDFYGMELVIDKIVGYFKHAAQGLEERKQILYLLGGVGSAKSSLAERLKRLMEQEPIYVLCSCDEISPVFESPLGLFKKEDCLELNVPEHYFKERLSPWALKRLKEFNGDVSKFSVLKTYPSQANQIAISKTEPGDENNQDISALVGKIDIRKLAEFSQNDPDAYSYSGGLCLANQGLLEFVEMFKAPIKVLHPLLTATQEGNYNGTEAISSIPFEGIILAHSNESEWISFRNNKANEAFIDRINIIKVPYAVRESEEVKIYQKLIRESSLKDAPCAPYTLELLAQFAVLSRLKEEPKGIDLFTKMKVYNGFNMLDEDVKARHFTDYKHDAGVDEGMSGISTRFSFKVLSKVYNYENNEIAADPVHLYYVLQDEVKDLQLPKELEEKYNNFITLLFITKYLVLLEKDIQMAYLETADDYGQTLFDRYILYADMWLQDQDYRDPITGDILDRTYLNRELEVVEKLAGITNAKDFRSETVNFVLRARANNKGNNFSWRSYDKLQKVIEKVMFSKTKDLLPIISYGQKKSGEEAKKHHAFTERMMKRGYTKKQVETHVKWFIDRRKDM